MAALLAHLRSGSVRVGPGQRVGPHDIIGEVGNSGNSLAPHLHLQLMDSADPLGARIIPFRVREYERRDGTSWRPVTNGTLAGGDRIRHGS